MPQEQFAVVEEVHKPKNEMAIEEESAKIANCIPDEASANESKTKEANAETATTKEVTTTETERKPTESDTKERPTIAETSAAPLQTPEPSVKKSSLKKSIYHNSHDDNLKDNLQQLNPKPNESYIEETSATDDDLTQGRQQDSGDSDSDSNSEYSLRTNVSYLYQKMIMAKPDFFTILGEIPDIDEISSDISLPLFQLSRLTFKPMKSVVDIASDVGKFVNPLTGQVETDKEEEEEDDNEVVEEVEEESELENFNEEDDDLLVLLEADAQVVAVERKPAEDEVFETFLEMETGFKEAVKPEIDYEALVREATKRQLVVITIEFLSELIRTVVATCEYLDPIVILRHNLDKVKLMEDIEAKLAELHIEQNARTFLNRKVVEYYRRKRAFRSILDDNPETKERDIQRFKEAKIKLDLMLGKEVDVTSAATAKIANLKMELTAREAEVRHEVTDFEDMAKNSLRRDTFDKLPQVVLNLLSRMDKLRDEVSEVRLILLQRQHTNATLLQEMDKLENICDGLRMADFERLQTETQALGKKIEERNSDLNKLRIRCNSELQVRAHMREKQKMLQISVGIQKNVLGTLQRQRNDCRDALFDLKMKRASIRTEMRELSYQGGILDKPALMFDYDDTVGKIKCLNNKIKQDKAKCKGLQQKLKHLEERCE